MFLITTRKVHNTYKKTEYREVRHKKRRQNLWKNLWILCITYPGKLEKRGICRRKQNKNVEKNRIKLIKKSCKKYQNCVTSFKYLQISGNYAGKMEHCGETLCLGKSDKISSTLPSYIVIAAF